MKILRIQGIGRRYLRLAAAYLRFAGDAPGYDFSKEALMECFINESSGKPSSKLNGYTYGKWCKDISVTNWIEDIHKGNACKAEFYTPKDRWWSEKALANVVVRYAFFPFSSAYRSKSCP